MKSFGSKRAGERAPGGGAKKAPAGTSAEPPEQAPPQQASPRQASRNASPATIRDVAKAAGVSPMTIS